MKIIYLISILFIFNFIIQSCSHSTNKDLKNQKTNDNIENVLFLKKNKNEKFKQLEVSEINSKISQSDSKLSPISIMRMYYPYDLGMEEGSKFEKVFIISKFLVNGNIEVTLIHDYLADDSVKGEKFIMELKRKGESWIVVTLKTNWTCYDGRGHTNWGIKNCT